ncbi:MAG: sulfurtransferase complex subunit TusD [Pseudomonadota bacterium]
MKISLLVTAAPADSYGVDPAWQFAKATLRRGHQLHRIFFYGDGVYHGNGLAVQAQNESNPASRWARLAEDHGTELVLCIASATRRGMLDNDEAHRLEQSAASAHPNFVLSGLGQWADVQLTADRIVHFGPSHG